MTSSSGNMHCKLAQTDNSICKPSTCPRDFYQASHTLLRLRKGRLLAAERLRIKALLQRRRQQRRRRLRVAPAAAALARHRAPGVHVVRTPPHHLREPGACIVKCLLYTRAVQ